MKNISQSKKLYIELGNFIKLARQERKITQNKLAKLAKVNQEAISRAEKHGCTPTYAEKLLKAMKYELNFHHISWGTKDSHSTSFISSWQGIK